MGVDGDPIITGSQTPNSPCNCMVDSWALKGFLYPYFGVYLGTIMILGRFEKHSQIMSTTRITRTRRCSFRRASRCFDSPILQAAPPPPGSKVPKYGVLGVSIFRNPNYGFW